MTFLQLQNAVLDNINRTDKLSVIKNGINFGLQEIAKVHEWYALRKNADLSIAIGDLSTTLPVDLYQLVEARLINPTSTTLSYPFKVISKLKFVQTFPNVTAYVTGRPYVGYHEQTTFYYFPKSSAVYTLRLTYLTLPVTLSADSDLNPLTECDQTLIYFATAYVFKSLQMFEASNQWMGSYMQSLEQSVLAEKRHIATEVKLEQFTQDNDTVYSSPEPWNDPFAGR